MKKQVYGQYGSMTKEREENDWYPTPNEAVVMLLSNLETCLSVPILDAGAGQGNILKHFQRNNTNIFGVELVDRGNPDNLNILMGVNFLEYKNDKTIRTIIMNPPYNLSDKFVRHAINLISNDGIVIALLRHTWMCGKRRSDLIRQLEQIIMCGRLKMLPAGRVDLDKGHSGTVDFSWFVFRKHDVRRTALVRA